MPKLQVRIKPIIFFLGLFFLSAFTYLLGVRHVGFAIWGDSHYYYAYTRSIVMDRDINFINEARQRKYPFPNGLKIVKQTGYAATNFSPGTGLLWIPGFLIGQMLAFSDHWLGGVISLDGYSLITQLAVGISTIAMSVLGLYFVFLSLKLFFAQNIALLATLALFLTSQIFYYTTIDPMNSHSAEFLFASLCLWLVLKLKLNQPKQKISLAVLGVSLGFLSIIRNQDFLTATALIIFLFAADFRWLFLRQKRRQLWQNFLNLILPLMAIIAIQLSFTWIIYRQINSPYLINGAKFDWFHPDIFRVLFTANNGFWYYAPAMFCALIGLGFFYGKVYHQFKHPRVLKQLILTSFVVFLLQVYLIASWPAEVLGGPYGSRMFTGTLPFLSFGLAWLINWFKDRSRKWQFSAIGLLIAFFVWNVWQIYWMLLIW